MRTDYGKWSINCKIHAVGYDGKWLCGRKGMTSSECSNDLKEVSCKECLKKLNEYLIKYSLPTSLLEKLEEALKNLGELAKAIEGKKSNCLNPSEIYINTWIKAQIEQVIQYYKEAEQ